MAATNSKGNISYREEVVIDYSYSAAFLSLGYLQLDKLQSTFIVSECIKSMAKELSVMRVLGNCECVIRERSYTLKRVKSYA